MWGRCSQASRPDAHRYFGLPIQLDWVDFANFLRDMGPRPDGTTLDRIDNAQGYTAKNCRWATPAEQNANRRTTVLVSGKPAAVASRDLGLSRSTIWKRIKKSGMSPEEAAAYTRPTWSHGTRQGYEKGCRCTQCRAAHAERMRVRRARSKG